MIHGFSYNFCKISIKFLNFFTDFNFYVNFKEKKAECTRKTSLTSTLAIITFIYQMIILYRNSVVLAGYENTNLGC